MSAIAGASKAAEAAEAKVVGEVVGIDDGLRTMAYRYGDAAWA